MIRKSLGIIKDDELQELKKIFKRRIALENLFSLLSQKKVAEDVNEMYNRIVDDMAETLSKMNTWWIDMVKKYEWSIIPTQQWTVDFETSEVYIVE